MGPLKKLRTVMLVLGVVGAFVCVALSMAVPKPRELGPQVPLPRVTCSEVEERLHSHAGEPFVIRANRIERDADRPGWSVLSCGSESVAVRGGPDVQAPSDLQIEGNSSFHVRPVSGGLEIVRTCLGCDSFPEDREPLSVVLMHKFGFVAGIIATCGFFVFWYSRRRQPIVIEELSHPDGSAPARRVVAEETDRLYRDRDEGARHFDVLYPTGATRLSVGMAAVAVLLLGGASYFAHADVELGRGIALAMLAFGVAVGAAIPPNLEWVLLGRISWAASSPPIVELPEGQEIALKKALVERTPDGGYCLVLEAADTGKRHVVEKVPGPAAGDDEEAISVKDRKAEAEAAAGSLNALVMPT